MIEKAGFRKKRQHVRASGGLEINSGVEADEQEYKQRSSRGQCEQTQGFESRDGPCFVGWRFYGFDVEIGQDEQGWHKGNEGEVEWDHQSQNKGRNPKRGCTSQGSGSGKQVNQDGGQEYGIGFYVSKKELNKAGGEQEGQDKCAFNRIFSEGPRCGQTKDQVAHASDIAEGLVGGFGGRPEAYS